MKQLAFFIDVDRCIYCQSCTIACSNENQTGNYRRRKVLSIPDHIHFGVINFSMSCNHCETPACMTVCKYNSIRKLKNGIVILDSNTCVGCGKCESVCPFSAIYINPLTNKADKCDMCYDRQRQGKQPVCVESCIANAISINNIMEDYPSEYQSPIREFSMKSITNPSIRFKYTRKDSTCFWALERDEHNENINL